VCLGYKGYMIKEYFANYALHMSDVTVDLQKGTIDVHRNLAEDWRICLVDTGDETMTGGRLKRALPYVGQEETFCLTYGDGVADVDIAALINFHREHGGLATVTGVRPPSRFGQLGLEGSHVREFVEKPIEEGGWINGGFFVLERGIERYLGDDSTIWERDPMERLAGDGQLHAFLHEGFFSPMDTIRDKHYLEDLWSQRKAPWRVWS
jgi:glucose-1-phosphate cytidylyltransferase